MAVGSLGFYLVGWGLAVSGILWNAVAVAQSPAQKAPLRSLISSQYGPAAEGVPSWLAAIIGTSQFLFIGVTNEWANIVFQWTFAATSTTIVSGAAAGRIKFVAYVILSFTQTCFVYPLVAHWVWAEDGWLYKLGVVDLAGDAAVHLLGGMVGLVATVYMGPRKGVFSPSGKYLPLRSSPLNAAFGGLILWWCWFAFNAGSTLGVSGGRDVLAAIVSWNTAISAGAAVGAAMGLSFYRSNGRFVDIFDLVTGLLAGLVGVTAGAHVMESWAALLTGGVCSLVAIFMGEWLATLGIDDPVGAVPVHVGAAAVGLLFTGLFALPVSEGRGNTLAGAFYGGDGTLLGVQLLCVVSTAVFGLVCGYLQMLGLDKVMSGGVRVSKRDEEAGLDKSEHNLIQIHVSRHADGLDLSGSDSDSEEEGGLNPLGEDGGDEDGGGVDLSALKGSPSVSPTALKRSKLGPGPEGDEPKRACDAALVRELGDGKGAFASFLLDSGQSNGSNSSRTSRATGTTDGSPMHRFRGLSGLVESGSVYDGRESVGSRRHHDGTGGASNSLSGVDAAGNPVIRTAYGNGGIYYGSRAPRHGKDSKRKNAAKLLSAMQKQTHKKTVKEMKSSQAKLARQLLRLTAEMILERTQDDIAWVPIHQLDAFQQNYSAVSAADGAHSSLTVEQMHPSVKKLQDHARRKSAAMSLKNAARKSSAASAFAEAAAAAASAEAKPSPTHQHHGMHDHAFVSHESIVETIDEEDEQDGDIPGALATGERSHGMAIAGRGQPGAPTLSIQSTRTELAGQPAAISLPPVIDDT